MSARIRHLALYTENQQEMASFYKTVFGMKRITESFNQPNHDHISDGVIGLAVLRRRPGFHAALDHFGFEMDDNGMPTEKGLKNVASMAEVSANVPMEKIVDWTLIKEAAGARSK
ncbi:MAG TPA: VOC family protein [Candidatus Binatia bacterium]